MTCDVREVFLVRACFRFASVPAFLCNRCHLWGFERLICVSEIGGVCTVCH